MRSRDKNQPMNKGVTLMPRLWAPNVMYHKKGTGEMDDSRSGAANEHSGSENILHWIGRKLLKI
jgi:hypothetical protein